MCLMFTNRLKYSAKVIQPTELKVKKWLIWLLEN